MQAATPAPPKGWRLLCTSLRPASVGMAPTPKGEKVPSDPWGNRYNYRSPGEHGKYDLYSYGADGRDGGMGNDADITSWDTAAPTASNEQR